MIQISDMTMKQTHESLNLSFKEKIELAKLLDKLGVSVIELEGIGDSKIDDLRIKSIAMAVQDCAIAVPVPLEEAGILRTWQAVQQARHPRLQVCAPVSAVQMEYLYHKKPDAMEKSIRQAISLCKSHCETEFVALDATRGEENFLAQVISQAIDAGADIVTLCDTAGAMLPEEFSQFIQRLYQAVPALKQVTLGVLCSDNLAMADACSIAAITAGARVIKAAAYPVDAPSVANIAKILNSRPDSFPAGCGVSPLGMNRTILQIARICQGNGSVTAGQQWEDAGDQIYLTVHDDETAIARAVERLGYDLSDEDMKKVYESFRPLAEKKEKVGIRELDAIVAACSMQVPATYQLDTYVITSGNAISSTAHMKLRSNGQVLEGVYMGDGPIDAAFLAIEKITDLHYELDDFQIQAVTEGRDSMGQTVVKLRSGGKLYSGRGISTDIVGASIRAYLSALNKIVYEEAEA